VDLAAAFLLSLLGGYCFAYVWRAIAFTTKRADGHHLYFRAALCGTIFFSIALVLRVALVLNIPSYLIFDSTLVEYVKPALKEEPGLGSPERTRRAEWVVTAVYSLLLGTACGVAANIFTPRRWALKRSANAFDRLMLDAQQDGRALALTLNTSNVYVGLVVEAPDPIREPAAVTLLPTFSGRRDAEGRLILTTDYETIYSTLERRRAVQPGLSIDWSSQFELTIRADEIVTAAPFSVDIYGEFNPGWRQRIAQQNCDAPGESGCEDFTSADPPSYVLSSIGTNRKFSGPT
jgi:hypothetical protein